MRRFYLQAILWAALAIGACSVLPGPADADELTDRLIASLHARAELEPAPETEARKRSRAWRQFRKELLVLDLSFENRQRARRRTEVSR